MYAPLDGSVVDTTFQFAWDAVSKTAFALIEGSVYNSTPSEDFFYRQAVKNGNSPEEILAWAHWAEPMAEINRQLVVLSGASLAASLTSTTQPQSEEIPDSSGQ